MEHRHDGPDPAGCGLRRSPAVVHPAPARPLLAAPTFLPAALRGTALGARFSSHLRDSGLIRPGDTVVVALSGGVDSTVLLHLLRLMRASWRLQLVAAHFDHRMRPGSDRDAAWVAGLCRAWDVPLERGEARHPPRNEEEARAARYAFLETVARESAADRIATGHHADDQAETVLFRLIRGTGLPGMAGIPASRDGIVRPLLPFWRTEILAYAGAAGLRYREDPMNRSLDPARNRLRHDVIPRLEAIAPGAARAVVRLAEHARDDADAWDRVLAELEAEVVVADENGGVELARPLLLSYHPRVLGRVLRRILRRLGSHPDRVGTRAAVEFITCGASGGAIQVAGGVRIERDFDRIRISRVPREAPAAAAERPLVISSAEDGHGVAVLGDGRSATVRWAVKRGVDPGGAVAFRVDDLRFPLEVRTWNPGDRIRLSYGTKKLKKLFAEHRVGRADRGRVPILADAVGRVLWVDGIARADLPAPAPDDVSFGVTVMDAEVA